MQNLIDHFSVIELKLHEISEALHAGRAMIEAAGFSADDKSRALGDLQLAINSASRAHGSAQGVTLAAMFPELVA